MDIPTHFVSSEEQEKENGISACGSMNWQSGTTDPNNVTCPICLEIMHEWENDTYQRQIIQVTHEMAMDAGDPSLEGQYIEW